MDALFLTADAYYYDHHYSAKHAIRVEQSGKQTRWGGIMCSLCGHAGNLDQHAHASIGMAPAEQRGPRVEQAVVQALSENQQCAPAGHLEVIEKMPADDAHGAETTMFLRSRYRSLEAASLFASTGHGRYLLVIVH